MKYFRPFFLLLVLIGNVGAFGQVKLNTIRIKDHKALQEFFRYTPGKRPLLCAHRGGAMKGYPENCIATFEHTLSKMQAFFEVDPRLTKDSVVVVMHDATLDRTTNGKGKIADYTWAELQQFKLKDPEGQISSYGIPLLKDVLNWAKGKTILMLDKKNVPMPMLLKLIEKEKAEGHILISSYSPEEAKFYYERNPKLMFEAFIKTEEKMREYEAAGVPWKNIVAYLSQPTGRKKLMDELHARQVMCILYTTPFFEKIKDEQQRLSSYPQLIRDGADVLLSDHVFEVETAIREVKNLKHMDAKDYTRSTAAFFSHTRGVTPLISGHRGGVVPGYPENSIAAFEHTLSYTSAFFEVDPRITKDSVIVLMHDATLERTTNGSGKVADFSFEQLKKLRLKDLNGKVTAYGIPSLKEALAWGKGKTILNFDKKDVPLEMTARLIGEWKVEEQVMLTVHNAKEAQFYHQINPKIRFSAFILTEQAMQEYEDAGIPWSNVMAYVGPKVKPENKALINQLHARGVRCMISAASSYDKLTDAAGRKAAYQEIINSGAEVVESDLPIEVAKAVQESGSAAVEQE
ncbi:MAG: glycerophosphodiester phosphodiesterase family protein [Bacteroidota bacterium]